MFYHGFALDNNMYLLICRFREGVVIVNVYGFLVVCSGKSDHIYAYSLCFSLSMPFGLQDTGFKAVETYIRCKKCNGKGKREILGAQALSTFQ